MRLLKHGHIIKIITEYNRLFRTGTCLLLNPGNRFSLGRFLQINIHPAVPGNIYTEAIAPSFIYFLIDIYSSVRAVDSHFNTFIYIGFQILYHTFISFVASQNTFAERFIFRICIESIYCGKHHIAPFHFPGFIQKFAKLLCRKIQRPLFFSIFFNTGSIVRHVIDSFTDRLKHRINAAGMAAAGCCKDDPLFCKFFNHFQIFWIKICISLRNQRSINITDDQFYHKLCSPLFF